jgi:hypothetical protein
LDQVVCFEQKKSPEHPSQIFIVGRSNGENDSATMNSHNSFRTTPRNIPNPHGISHDFPITMTASKCDDLVYMITRMGCLHIIDTHTGFTLYSQLLFDSNSLIFVSCLTGLSGMLCVTRLLGQVFKVEIQHDKAFESALARDELVDFVPEVGISSLSSLSSRDDSLEKDIGKFLRERLAMTARRPTTSCQLHRRWSWLIMMGKMTVKKTYGTQIGSRAVG